MAEAMELKVGQDFTSEEGEELSVVTIIEVEVNDGDDTSVYLVRADDGFEYEVWFEGDGWVGAVEEDEEAEMDDEEAPKELDFGSHKFEEEYEADRDPEKF